MPRRRAHFVFAPKVYYARGSRGDAPVVVVALAGRKTRSGASWAAAAATAWLALDGGTAGASRCTFDLNGDDDEGRPWGVHAWPRLDPAWRYRPCQRG